MKQLIKKFKQITILLLVLSFAGCDDDEVMLPEIVPGFTYTVNENTGAVTFINTSVNSKNYFWTFGDGTSSTLNNPVNIYATGTYTVTLKATNIAGASAMYSAEIDVLVKEAMSLPVTFDDAAVIYEASVFNGAIFEIVENPDVSGSNDKASNVGAITNSGAAYEGLYFDLGAPIDLAADKKVTMNVWSDVAVGVLIKLEEGTAGSIEGSASHGGTGWEMISVEFNSSANYSRLTMFVDGPGTTAGTFYIDDIAQAKSNPVITLLGDENMSVEIGSTFTDPGATAVDGYGADISSSIVVGGDTVDTNTVGTYTITYNVSDDGNAAAEVTRTVNVAADAVAPVITLTGDATINIMVGDAFTDQGATATDNIDGDITANIVVGGDTVDVNTAGTYTITYNVSDAAGNPAAEVTRTVTVEAVSNPEIAYFYSTAGIVDIPNDWDNWGTGTAQDGEYDQDATYNPCIKLTGTGSWGTVAAFTNFPAGTMSEYGNLEFKIKSSDPWIKVKVPEEERQFTIADGTSLAGGWTQMSIPLSTFGAAAVDAAVQFAIFGSGNATIYLTDIGLSGDGNGGGGGGGGTGGGTGACTGTLVSAVDFPVDFEGCETFMDTTGGVKFGDAISAELAANPSQSGINTSAYVLKVDKPAGASHWEGVQNAFAADFDSSLTFKVKIYTTKANVTYQFEISNDPNEPGVGNPTPITKVVANANTWTEVEVTFPNVPSGGHNNFVIKPDDNGSGTVSVGAIHYFDDVRLE